MTRYASAVTKHVGAVSLLMVLALVLVTGVIAAPAQQNGVNVKIQPDSQTIQVGDTTTVDVQVENVSNLFGVDLQLSFDPSIVQVVDSNPLVPGVQIEPGSFLDISGGNGFVVDNSVDNTAGTITYAATLLAPAAPVSGSGPLVRITFEGVAEGESSVMLTSVLLSDDKAQPIEASTADGRIIVEGEGVPPTKPPTEVPGEGNVVVSGTVQSCLDGGGVSGATVRILEAPQFSTTTDANGNYALVASLVLPAEYTIEVSHPTFFSPSRKTTGQIQQPGKDRVSVVVNFTGVDCLKGKPTPSPTFTPTPTLTPTPTITPTPVRQKPQTLLILDGAATLCDTSEVRDGAVVEIVTPQGGIQASQPVSYRGEYFFYEDFQGLEGIYYIRFRDLDGNVQYLRDVDGSQEFELIDTDNDGDIDSDDLFIKENMRQLNFVGVNCIDLDKPSEPDHPYPDKPDKPSKPDHPYPDRPDKPDKKQCVHVVRYGETLYSIARRYGSSVSAIAMANGIYHVDYIRPGMKLVIPDCYGTPPYHPPVEDCIRYKVQMGDTLYSIARWYGTSVYDVAHANNIVNPWYIKAGMKLTICPAYDHGKGYQDGYKWDDGYGKDGYNGNGYDKNGYDRNGYDKNGYDKNGYDRNGYDWNGYDKDGHQKGHDDGYMKDDGRDADGYDRNGYDKNGYDRNGYDRNGYDRNGYHNDGYQKDGYQKDGYHKAYDDGFDKGYGYDYHVVKPGDTVYSIAMHYGVAPQAIVYLNHLSNPHAILVGQKLRLP
jgi:LysM repeat protein